MPVGVFLWFGSLEIKPRDERKGLEKRRKKSKKQGLRFVLLSLGLFFGRSQNQKRNLAFQSNVETHSSAHTDKEFRFGNVNEGPI